jgi:hypothetical protein
MVAWSDECFLQLTLLVTAKHRPRCIVASHGLINAALIPIVYKIDSVAEACLPNTMSRNPFVPVFWTVKV